MEAKKLSPEEYLQFLREMNERAKYIPTMFVRVYGTLRDTNGQKWLFVLADPAPDMYSPAADIELEGNTLIVRFRIALDVDFGRQSIPADSIPTVFWGDWAKDHEQEIPSEWLGSGLGMRRVAVPIPEDAEKIIISE